MNEREFVTKKREAWDRLEALLAKANRRNGIKTLTRQELLELGPLYRRASSDLAMAQNRAHNEDLVSHLNALVGKAHTLLYEVRHEKGSPFQAIIQFYLYEFPALLQQYTKYFLVAWSVFIIGLIFSYQLVIHNPEKLNLFIPEGLRDSAEGWKAGKVVSEDNAAFAAQLMTHNFQVGIISATSGVIGGIPTLDMMFMTGGMLGGLSAAITQAKQHHTFWPGIVPHGFMEVSAIFICGAAGFVLGVGILFPGSNSRMDSFRLRGTEAIKLTLGTVPIFIFSGVIEAMFSRLPISTTIRYVFTIVTGIMWYLYLFLPRRTLLKEAENSEG